MESEENRRILTEMGMFHREREMDGWKREKGKKRTKKLHSMSLLLNPSFTIVCNVRWKKFNHLYKTWTAKLPRILKYFLYFFTAQFFFYVREKERKREDWKK